ncbi:hypothetical protein [Pedobacter paludis]|uniref:Lipoprotein n=1 Tax=Pedobacter paludis TaxID=2203212 RepID=A0A317EYE1_9SPHI|nr:hypothetical protein [Pedobacter paludis]PWS30817.1 hypothetical protein DF947_14485 [Pedobacter paludis]
MKKSLYFFFLLFLSIGCSDTGSSKPESISSILLKAYQAKSISDGANFLIQKGYKLSRKIENKVLPQSITMLEFEGDRLISLKAVENNITELTCLTNQIDEVASLKEDLIKNFNFKLEQRKLAVNQTIKTDIYSNDQIVAKIVTANNKDGKGSISSISFKQKNKIPYLKSF